MAWRSLSEMSPSLRRTWQRRYAAGVAQTYVDSETKVIDLEGKTAIPGFIEGHAHFTGIGNANLQLNLMDVANWDEIIAMVEAAVAEAQPGELIRGRGWHQEKWDRIPDPNVDGLPFHQALSAVSPDNPTLTVRAIRTISRRTTQE